MSEIYDLILLLVLGGQMAILLNVSFYLNNGKRNTYVQIASNTVLLTWFFTIILLSAIHDYESGWLELILFGNIFLHYYCICFLIKKHEPDKRDSMIKGLEFLLEDERRVQRNKEREQEQKSNKSL